MRKMLISLALASCAPAVARVPQSPPPPDPNAEIIVEGRKLDPHDVAKAVSAISNPEPTGGFESQYPRWADRICVLVAGFPRDGAQFIADRIGAIARDLKLDPGLPGCSPNIFIIATNDPTKLIAGLRLKRVGLATGRDAATVRSVQDSHDAVRWIGATAMQGSSGEPTNPGAYGLAGRSTPEFDSYDGGSRLVARTRVMLTRETIVVDIRQIDGLNYGQLSDYLAFVALAQLNPHAAAPGVDTVLSLFPRGGTAPAGLTKFDEAYLRGLYQSPPGAVGTLQKGAIEATISRALHPKAAAVPAKEPAAGG